jgi:hypothetical protein
MRCIHTNSFYARHGSRGDGTERQLIGNPAAHAQLCYVISIIISTLHLSGTEDKAAATKGMSLSPIHVLSSDFVVARVRYITWNSEKWDKVRSETTSGL